MKAIKRFFLWIRELLLKPSTRIGLGILVIIGFAGGVWFWWGFNKVLEVTNTEEFCLSCHTMHDNLLPELQKTVHWQNRTGVRAHCQDCHVPHDLSDKIARKMQASREVWGQLVGTIDNRELFKEKRLHLAQREWERFKANNSKECRNCHDYDSMDFSKMRVTSQMIMRSAAERNASCIDCHKGIAHQLPDLGNVHNPAFQSLLAEAANTKISTNQLYYNVHPKAPIYLDTKLEQQAGTLEVAAPLTVIKQEGNASEIELTMWRKNKGYGRVWHSHFGLNIVDAVIEKDLAQNNDIINVLETKEDALTGLEWQKVTARFWIENGNLMKNIETAWDIAEQAYTDNCSVCHRQPSPSGHDANQWIGLFGGMVGFTNLDDQTANLILKYLQLNSSDFKTSAHGAGSPEQTIQMAHP